MKNDAQSAADRLMDRFAQKYRVCPISGCWLWTASVDRAGYGQFNVNGVCGKAHRISYEMFVGPIGDLHVCHHCDTPSCVNPQHLFIGTNADNHADRDRKGRVQRGERHYKAKLNNISVLEIRAASGKHQEIAKRYGVSQSLVSLVKSRSIWTHVK